MADDNTVEAEGEIIIDDDEDERRPGCSGCVWGLAGALGCLSVPLIVFVIAILLGLTTINNIVGGLRLIFVPSYTTRSLSTTLLESVQSMSQLTTTRYNFSNIVTSEREMPGILAGLYGDRLVMVAVGHVTAGIELAELTEGDVTMDGGTMILRLPAPTLQDCFLSVDNSYVISRDTGIFTQAAPNLDTDSRRFAVDQFRDMALERGILDDVQTQATIALEEFVKGLGLEAVTTVRIVTKPPDSDAELPETCR